MGKIVKYCNSCEEGFAEKFGFCPNCGANLTAFEMNPLGAPSEVAPPVAPVAAATTNGTNGSSIAAPEIDAAPDVTPVVATAVPANAATVKSDAAAAEIRDVRVDEKPAVADGFVKATKARAASASNGSTNGGNGSKQTNSNYVVSSTNADYDGYHITVIEEKNVRQRNMLLLGSFALMTTLAIGGTIYSLFNQNLLVGSIGDDMSLTALVPSVEPPPEMETEPPPKKDKDDGGGGGGGGRKEQTDASKGRLVSQTKNPVTPPSVNIQQLTNPSIPIVQQTKGPEKVRPITTERAGLPNGLTGDVLSNGRGSGSGIGSGRGNGIGSGIGDGEGSGNGSGSGSGNGNGYGGGTGDGQGRTPPPPPPPVAKKPAVTTPRVILDKPKAPYTDTARQNQVQGTVVLKVTFLASGQIGNVTTVSGLPYGLTEKAIAAAKAIKFKPAEKDGVPYTTSATLQYNFNIY